MLRTGFHNAHNLLLLFCRASYKRLFDVYHDIHVSYWLKTFKDTSLQAWRLDSVWVRHSSDTVAVYRPRIICSD